MGTTFWPYHPMESARCFFLYEMHSFATGIRKAGLKDSNARQRSVAEKKTVKTARGAYNVDDENVVFECEGSRK